ncbi:MAG: hypothetical protein CH6_3719 [Candidatus Kapaibacterium sp.]|nr:MAG: hypothetical protein CH6_3719 [Candidatus Kapabacteria bacterium]
MRVLALFFPVFCYKKSPLVKELLDFPLKTFLNYYFFFNYANFF